MTHISRFLPPTGRNVMTSCRYDAVIIWQMMALNAQLGAHTRLLAFLDAPLFMHLKCLLPSTASPPPPPARRHHLLLASCCVRRQHRNGALPVWPGAHLTQAPCRCRARGVQGDGGDAGPVCGGLAPHVSASQHASAKHQAGLRHAAGPARLPARCPACCMLPTWQDVFTA